MRLVVEQMLVGPMMNFAYIVGDADSGVCAVIDPGFDPEDIIAKAKSLGFKISAVLLTHGHFDHARAAGELSATCGAKVYVHRLDSTDLPGGVPKVLTEDESEIEIGSLKIKCLHTPGHSRGSQCFIVGNNIFTGDTLFVGGCGRVDLPGGSAKELLNSMKKLSSLDSEMVVYPGHEYGPSSSSTIGRERSQNPYMSADSEAMLI